MGNKVKLSVLGFSFNQTQSGTYGLVLSEDGALRRLMIVVGAPEAQSIAFQLQNTVPPRPLTHDLFSPLLTALDIRLKQVIIYQYLDGVFHSKMEFEQGNKIVEIDSRTSDAVAIALRTGAPIFTTEEIMQELAVVFDDLIESSAEDSILDSDDVPSTVVYDFSVLDKDELEVMLNDAIEGEDYELASQLRDEIVKKEALD